MDELAKLKKTGEAPVWMDEFGFKTLTAGYLLPDETPKAMYSRVAKAAASYYSDSKKWEKKFFDVMWKNWLCPSSPVLSNLGSKRGLPISCNSVHIGDNLDSIFMKNHELAMLSKNGAGVGIYFGDIRSRGAAIKGNGASEGIVPWCKVMDQTTVSVSQGCYDDQTEILTEKGWLFFKDINPEIKVAQVTETGSLSFTNYTNYICYPVKEDLYSFYNKTKSVNLLLTGNHRVAMERRKRISNKRDKGQKFISHEKKLTGHLDIIEAKDVNTHRDNRFWVSAREANGPKETLSFLDRFLIAHQADGSANPNGNSNGSISGTKIYTFHFKKERKINRLKEIVNKLGWDYTEYPGKANDITIAVRVPVSINLSKNLSDVFDFTKFSSSYAKEFINEVSLWDGSLIENGSITYSCVIKENVDFMQAVAFAAGLMSTLGAPSKKEEFHQLRHHIYICDRDSVGGEDVSKTLEYYEGNVYCVTVSTGLVVVRRKGAVVICGNSTRRGASAIYLPISHGDIEEFMNIRRPIGDINRRCLNINHGVCIDDDWMKSMLGGDKAKRSLWQELLKNRVETGEPYLMFTDNANSVNPDCYKDKGLTVKTSNICCLGADTLVLTKEGPQKIIDLVGKIVDIFDGEHWVKNNSFKERGKDKLIRITLKDGSHIDSNASHRWFVHSNDEIKTVYAVNLEVGQLLESHREIDRKEPTYIKSIEFLNDVVPVYCPTVPTTGKFALANGLMTGNSEIFLHTDPDHSFVCCLSSLNLTKWDEWKDTDLVNIAVRFLDAVLEEYIGKSDGIHGLEASQRSAIKGRAIGIGVLGWHTLLQMKELPFDSFDSMSLNAAIFSSMRKKAEEETAVLAKELGEPEWCKGHNRRNTHLLAVAPTVSNSTISGGYSAGIEPIAANIYSQKSAKGTFIRKNPILEQLLEKKKVNTLEVWNSINEYSGSAQHLDCLNENEKSVFLTAREINQHAIIKQASQRQRWIDQGQSVNLFFASNSSAKYIHEVHLAAWEGKLKSLYYLRTEGVIRGDLASRSKEECSACEG